MNALFRWAGSKKKLVPTLKEMMPVTYERYVEPFCGSACLFFDQLPEKALLTDINPELIHSYELIKKSPLEVSKCLLEMKDDNETYLNIRALNPTLLSPEKRAARFIYLNKLCFNGVYRTNKKGMFNVPKGSRTGSLPDYGLLSDYSNVIQNVDFECCSFFDIKNRILNTDFIYLDPPYSKPDSKNRGEYGPDSFSYTSIDELIDLLGYVDELGAKFMLSYCEYPELQEKMNANWTLDVVKVRRHVAGFAKHRSEVKEIIIRNYS